MIVPKDNKILETSHDVASAVVIEWRALTIALLDRLAPLVRTELGVDAATFPLAKVLEGGTWRAGRQIANQKRPTVHRQSLLPPMALFSNPIEGAKCLQM